MHFWAFCDHLKLQWLNSIHFIHQYYYFWKHCLISSFASFKFLSILCWLFAVWVSIQLAWRSMQNFIKSHKISSFTLNLMSIELAMQPTYCCQLEKLWMQFWVSSSFLAAFSGAQFFLIMLPGTARSHFSLWWEQSKQSVFLQAGEEIKY